MQITSSAISNIDRQKMGMLISLRRLQEVSRADFLTSVGLYILSDRVVMARLRKSFLNIAVLGQETRDLPQADNRQAISELTGWVAEDVREIALKAEGDSHERSLRQAIVSLLPRFNVARDAIYLCMPEEYTIIQQVFLPLAAKDNLQQVLEYELERQLPFKRDDLYYDFVPVGQKGEKYSVYVFAVPKKNIDGLLSLLGSFGIRPLGVETPITAIANYLLFSDSSSDPCAAVVTGHLRHWEMIGVQTRADGWQPAAQLLFCHQLPAAEWAQGANRELLQDGLSQVPKLYRCGDLTPLNGLAAGRLETAVDMTTLSNPRLKGLTRVEPAVLPAIGAALRGVREASIGANLLRSEGLYRRGRNTLSLLNTILLGLLVIVLIVWGLGFPIKDELRLRQLQKDNQALEPAVTALRRQENELEQLRKEAGLVADLERRRGEILRMLDELSKIVPASAYFSNLRYRAGVLEAQGNAENASALIPLLERSPVFENVGFNAPSNRGRDNRETFSLKADLEKPKAAAVKEASKEIKNQPTKETKATR